MDAPGVTMPNRGVGNARLNDIHASAAESQIHDTSTNDAVSNVQLTASEATRAQISLKARKRTKTGCLTCRKRRIKCGEERPTCANCLKSKRSCEGYAPRVVFKDPLGAFRPTGWAVKAGGAHYPALSGQVRVSGQYGRSQPGSTTQSQLPAIAPRPSPPDSHDGPYPHPISTASCWSGEQYYSHAPSFTPQNRASDDLLPGMRQLYGSQDLSSNVNQSISKAETLAANSQGSNTDTMLQHYHNGDSDRLVDVGYVGFPNDWSQSSASSNGSFPQPPPFNPAEDVSSQATVGDPTHFNSQPLCSQRPGQTSSPVRPRAPQTTTLVEGQRSLQQTQLDQACTPSTQTFPNLEGHIWSVGNGPAGSIYENCEQDHEPARLSETELREISMDGKALGPFVRPLSLQPAVSTEEPEDEYFDVDSDENEDIARNHIASTPQSDLGLMLALAASQDDRTLRSYTTFLNEPNVLSTHQPAFTASPLMDSKTARIFCHFITATGPSLSIYERHPANSSVMFTGAPVPSSQQALWTYTLPMMALTHQGLLHAMLALASLHIAKLQQTSAHASLKHYHFALRRIAKAVSTPARRREVATIAATLLLGFYEATTAEHSKWNSHLAGASQLLMELDFKGTTKRIKEERAKAEASQKIGSWYYPFGTFGKGHAQPYIGRELSNDVLMPNEDVVDENLVSNLMGWKVRYDEYGHIMDDSAPAEARRPIMAKDIDIYNLHRDLFWWYCKQDVYQSIISGNRLLMPYDRWGHCPPRAPIGKLDAVYGSMDHLILLMGRIADFASKDQARKRKAVEANGGQWRPPPGMVPDQPPGGSPPSQQQFRQVPPSYQPSNPLTIPNLSPEMYGMLPRVRPVRMPEAFAQGPGTEYLAKTTPTEGIEFEAATKEAEAEWREMSHALDVFEERLGSDYLPLSSEYMQPLDTPFGPAIYYRTYSMSCIWIVYYTGRIVLARAHPTMPPAAMMAAGIAASKTAQWANTIGRICAGLKPVSTSPPLNPSLGAALMESTLGFFFAGVQYRDAEQRRFTINALRNIDHLTGWESSALIAAGCETCWTKMAEAGRGPPYQKTMETVAKDDRMSGKRLPTGQEPLENNNDRRFVFINPGTRVHWAMGIMSVEEDFQGLNMGN